MTAQGTGVGVGGGWGVRKKILRNELQKIQPLELQGKKKSSTQPRYPGENPRFEH